LTLVESPIAIDFVDFSTIAARRFVTAFRRGLTMKAHRSTWLVLAASAVLAACDSATGPRSDFDPNRFPYLVSTTGVRLFGTSRVLVIPARFSDGAPPPISAAELQSQLFGGSQGGPMAIAFSHASNGAFTLRGQVSSWVTTTVTAAGLSAPTPPGAPSGLSLYVNSAIQLADQEIDFGRFDNDGPDGIPNSGDDDGSVDGGIAIMNSELNRYCNGGTGRGPHPFAILSLTPKLPTADLAPNGTPILVDGLTLLSATGCSATTAGGHVLAHELGHLFLGLPDLYHPVGGIGEVWATRRWVSGCWELMAAGSWGCGTGPPTLDYRINTLGAWSRTQLAWANPVLVDPTRDLTYELHPLGRGGTVLKVPIKAEEYLLIEYRERASAVDGKLPADGVLITHVVENLPQFPQSLNSPYRVSLIEADDDYTLLRTELQGGSRGEPGDAFGIGATSLKPVIHSRAKGADGAPFPFEITAVTVNAAAHRASLRIAPRVIAAAGR
jgi:M6 family metalloprotease-like protein